ncbi:hypothetical protein SAMN05443292_0418 [Halpernia frigidisoli]|uniref:Uncharacterized protein n=1 Tax=Halpernia frigidisoli TaxID=1125876 RepID=A0A1I3DEM6_9FLAO|nr:hypothetical protein SAMN05443292_0418 [Halpernia frigidisoli]
MKIFSKQNSISAFKNSLLFTLILTIIQLIWSYFDDSFREKNIEHYILRQSITFILMYLIYFFTVNYQNIGFKDLKSKFKKNNSDL